MRSVSEYVQVERFVAGEPDAHGNESEAWLPPERVGIYAFDPGGTSEPAMDGHDRVISEPTVYLPAKEVLNPRDRVVARGVTYEVDGVTREWWHPRRARRGNVVSLKVVGG